MGVIFKYKYYKFIAAALGLYLGGILGGISAFFLVRELIDHKDGRLDILELSLLRLCSLMIKADGYIDDEEVKLVRNFFINKFGENKSNELFKALKKSPPIPNNLDDILQTIKSRIEPSGLYVIIQFLYAISVSDGHLAVSEDEFIFRVGKKLGFTVNALNEIRSQFIEVDMGNESTHNSKYLKILGLPKDASLEDIKKAYRRLAKEYHPDRLVGVNDTIKKIAEEKFREISDAYQNLIH